MSVADVDALLYLPGHSREQLERTLRIPALSEGWQTSFQALLVQESSAKPVEGNPGLANEEQAPAWPGFRQMRVAHIHKESDSVTSFVLAPIDGQPLPIFRAGQFVVLRLLVDAGKPPVLRSYSLSDLPAADHFRISVIKTNRMQDRKCCPFLGATVPEKATYWMSVRREDFLPCVRARILLFC